MIRVHSPLHRSAAMTVASILLIVACMAMAVTASLYTTTFERAAEARGTETVEFYRERLRNQEQVWAEQVLREKARIEFLRMLENPRQRWQRLRAYITAMSTSPLHAGMAISDAEGREIFRHGKGFATQWPALPDIRRDTRIYGVDPQGGLYIALSHPVWLGADGMGAMHVMLPLDNAFLVDAAYPGSELFIEWRGRVVASSLGGSEFDKAPPGFSGRLDRAERRYEQRRIDFPAGVETPALLIQTHVAPPFSVGESIIVGAVTFALLALLLLLALHHWFSKLLPRIDMLKEASENHAREGCASPAVHEALARVIGDDEDELSAVGDSMRDMIAALMSREQEHAAAENRLRESEHRFRDAAESAGEFVWEVDAAQVYTYLSPGASIAFQRPIEDLVGHSVYDFIPVAERDEFAARTRARARTGAPFRRFPMTIARPDGEPRQLLFSGTAMRGPDGAPSGPYRGIGEDATARRRDEQNLLLADRVFANSGQAILITDANATILSVNPAFSAITGYTADEAIGKNPKAFASGRHDASFYATMWANLRRNDAWAGEVWDRRKNGEVYPKWLSINAVRDAVSDVVTHYVAIFSDITERKENEARIEHLAYHDALTGLPNRFALHARLAQSLADARRNHHQIALMFIDLDHFKTINDSLGHDIGDQLLVAVARRIAATLRESDTVARLGGDEFIIVVPGIESPEVAARVAEKVVECVGEPLALAGHELHVAPSIGIALFPADGDDADTLMKNADIAMYHAKQHGRNGYHFFAANMDALANERLLIETQLRAALDRGEFHLVYQPQVHLTSGGVIGVEALARWRHPERGLVLPEKFIPIAEETGLIIPLGAWVIEEACRQAAAWRAAGMPPLRMSVNLSIHQLRDRALARHVATILARTGLPAEWLELEITESAVMAHTDQALEVLRALHDLGVHLSIDDFGAGYSSLAYLKRLPITRLKIDRSFVMDMPGNVSDVAIAHGIVALGATLGMQVIAEGIETPEQLAILKGFDCVEGQGFLFSEPLSAEALRDYLQPTRVGDAGPPGHPPPSTRRLH